MPAELDRVSGCLVGLAVGDALGAPLEFMERREVRGKYPNGLREMVASTVWEAGEYTDDTQMALLLADSLLARRQLDARDIAQRFHEWHKSAKDVGIMTRAVLNSHGFQEFPEKAAANYFARFPDASAGNGALMRCAPVAISCLGRRELLAETSRLSARVTHFDPLAQSSCVILNEWLAEIILHGSKDGRQRGLAQLEETERTAWKKLEKIGAVPEEEIFSSGFTVHTLEAATWSFLTTESFEEAVVRAANLGDDADTVAAVCGALAGAYYGYAAIPIRWRNALKDEVRIRETALALYADHRRKHRQIPRGGGAS